MAEICPVVNTERILLSTDGSSFSEGAIREGIRIAKKCCSKLTAISVIETNAEFEALAPQYLAKQGKTARENLEAIRERAKQEGVDCGYAVFEGEDAYKVVTREADKEKSSLIVMGRRGRTGLARLVMGSTTARVIGHATCNVLVVPRAAEIAFKNILIATDGSRWSEAAAAEAIGLAKTNNASLTVVSVVPSEFMTPTDIDFVMISREKIVEKEMQEVEKHAKAVKEAAIKEGVAASAFVMSGKPADAIVEAARDKKVDLIIVGSHGRTGLEKLLMGSVAERVIVMSDCAVLIVKGKH